jgi:hypothetical protein
MNVKRPQPTLGQSLALFRAAQARDLERIRREMRRLERRARWLRFKHRVGL